MNDIPILPVEAPPPNRDWHYARCFAPAHATPSPLGHDVMNNNPPQTEIIFSAEGFTPSGDLLAHIQEKTRKLHRHAHPRIGAVRVRVVREEPSSAPPRFTVCATAHRTGADCIAHSVGVQPAPAIDAAFRKLERVLASITADRESDRCPPHPIEISVPLPKT